MNRTRRRRKYFPVSEPFWQWLIKAFAMPALLATPARAPGRNALPASQLDQAAREKLIALLGASGLRDDDGERARVSGGRHLSGLLLRRRGDAAFAPDGVVYPRHEADVQALLVLCAELGIAVVPVVGEDGVTRARGAHKAIVALDLGGLGRILTQDPVSGLMDVEAGITGAELQRQLDAQGLSLGENFTTSLGGWIASADLLPTPVQAVRVATPQGMLALESGLKHIQAGARAGLGIITSARLRVQPSPEGEDCRAYLFRDFAEGLAVLRQAARAGITLGAVRLSDDGATRFEQAMQRRPWNPGQRLFEAWLALRDFDKGVARLIVSFPGGSKQRRLARKSFEALTKKLGAMTLGQAQMPPPYPDDAFLDHGVGIDRLQLCASWSELPLRYARLRAGLKQAMRAWPPVAGAHGLVLAHVSDVRSHGAALTVTWLFPRKLEEEVTQASAIRQAALALAGGKTAQGLEQQMRRALKHAVDPRDILPP